MYKKFNNGLITICSTIPVLSAVSVSAKTVGNEHVKHDDVSRSVVAAVEEDDIPVFSPDKAFSKPDELPVLERVELGKEEKRTAKDAKVAKEERKEIKIITPVGGETTAKTTNLAVQYHPSLDVKVMVNGKSISSEFSSFVQKDEANQLYTKIWYNIPLQVGENIITAQTLEGQISSVKVIVKEQKTKLVFTPVGSTLR